ncbi:MAG: DNA-directed RNA polymerase subunit beta [Planctomycetota bacterium]|nr:DNA-directed RNA polymerase subunit beta [Planctomycetota bacterium]
MQVRRYGKARELAQVPPLTVTQREAYDKFLQSEEVPHKRTVEGLQKLFASSFPIESLDGKTSIEFLSYSLKEPRYEPDECRALGITYAMPLWGRLRLNREEPIEENVYLGDIPKMIGGGEFIINGAERIVVTQLQRSPGVDFSSETHTSGKKLFVCRVIPEYGSWLQIETSSKDELQLRIDSSNKLPFSMFMRCFNPEASTNEDLIEMFYETKKVSLGSKKNQRAVQRRRAAEDIVNEETGEYIIEAGDPLKDKVDELLEAGVKNVKVIVNVGDALMLNTIRSDEAKNYEEAVNKLYMKLRMTVPPNLEKAEELFNERFNNFERFSFGDIGRFRINREFGQIAPDDEHRLTFVDLLHIAKKIITLRKGSGELHDIDHLGHRRTRTISELLTEALRQSMLKVKRAARERMAQKDIDKARPSTLINRTIFESSVNHFFERGELSHIVDQTNPLSQLTHERRLSALGPGGLHRKRAGYDVRDVHHSHYGRICPIETPEGANIGLIVSLSLFATINKLGFITTPYAVVKNGVVTDEIVDLRADEEESAYIGEATLPRDDKGKITEKRVTARFEGDFVEVPPSKLQYLDVSPRQMVGVSAALIPFLENDDTARALMGSNMQRQAVPLLKTEAPLVGTGMEEEVARNSGMILRAKRDSKVAYVDGCRIEMDNGDVYQLRKFQRLNERTWLNQKPIVSEGQEVSKGEVLVDGVATDGDCLALGKNILVSFMPWEGYNFEDAILVSERLLQRDVFTSVHIEEFPVEVRETKLGKEEITRDIPGVSEELLNKLDDDGVVRVGTKVETGDILVGKVTPKSKSELSNEERLLRAIFQRYGEDVKNDSLVVKPGISGYVIDIKRFSRRSPSEEDEKMHKATIKGYKEEYEKNSKVLITALSKELSELLGDKFVNKRTGELLAIDPKSKTTDILRWHEDFNFDDLDIEDAELEERAWRIYRTFERRINKLLHEFEQRKIHLRQGDELPNNVLEMVKVYVAVKRVLSVGDKLAGRHGNKGCISQILPVEDMPFLEDGTPVDMILSPLGVPSRMNIGQILETHLGFAAKKLGFRAMTPVFDGAVFPEIQETLREAGLRDDGVSDLFDGRTGEKFSQRVTVGYIYMMKLHHLVTEKIHARSTGPYSLITQQPLGGKARFGGQRFGEMEVWALEAYGASHILQEILTVKSDDVDGRTKVYESIVKGDYTYEPHIPVSFEVLCNEIRGLGLNIKLEKDFPEQSEVSG